MSGTENMPALLPPPLEINDDNKRYDIATWCIAMCVLASIIVLLRLSIRMRDHTFMLDDYAAAFSLVSSSGSYSWMASCRSQHRGLTHNMCSLPTSRGLAWLFGRISIRVWANHSGRSRLESTSCGLGCVSRLMFSYLIVN